MLDRMFAATYECASIRSYVSVLVRMVSGWWGVVAQLPRRLSASWVGEPGSAV